MVAPKMGPRVSPWLAPSMVPLLTLFVLIPSSMGAVLHRALEVAPIAANSTHAGSDSQPQRSGSQTLLTTERLPAGQPKAVADRTSADSPRSKPILAKSIRGPLEERLLRPSLSSAPPSLLSGAEAGRPEAGATVRPVAAHRQPPGTALLAVASKADAPNATQIPPVFKTDRNATTATGVHWVLNATGMTTFPGTFPAYATAPGAKKEKKLPVAEDNYLFGLPKIFWALVATILAMLCYVACIPFILTLAKRRARPMLPAT